MIIIQRFASSAAAAAAEAQSFYVILASNLSRLNDSPLH